MYFACTYIHFNHARRNTRACTAEVHACSCLVHVCVTIIFLTCGSWVTEMGLFIRHESPFIRCALCSLCLTSCVTVHNLVTVMYRYTVCINAFCIQFKFAIINVNECRCTCMYSCTCIFQCRMVRHVFCASSCVNIGVGLSQLPKYSDTTCCIYMYLHSVNACRARSNSVSFKHHLFQVHSLYRNS